MRQSRRLESSCRFLSTSSTLGPGPRLLVDWSVIEQNPFVEVVGPATGVFSAISLPSAKQSSTRYRTYVETQIRILTFHQGGVVYSRGQSRTVSPLYQLRRHLTLQNVFQESSNGGITRRSKVVTAVACKVARPSISTATQPCSVLLGLV